MGINIHVEIEKVKTSPNPPTSPYKGCTTSGRSCYYGIGLETTEFPEGTSENNKKGSGGIRTLNNDLEEAEFTRFSEGLVPILNRLDLDMTHESKNMNMPSEPSELSEQADIGVPSSLDRVPWASVHAYLCQGNTQRIADFCRALWRVDYAAVIAEAHTRWPELAPTEVTP